MLQKSFTELVYHIYVKSKVSMCISFSSFINKFIYIYKLVVTTDSWAVRTFSRTYNINIGYGLLLFDLLKGPPNQPCIKHVMEISPLTHGPLQTHYITSSSREQKIRVQKEPEGHWFHGEQEVRVVKEPWTQPRGKDT